MIQENKMTKESDSLNPPNHSTLALDSLEDITRQLADALEHTAQSLIESGFLLLRAKKLLGHGKFRNWLNDNFSMSAKTANRFMNVALMVKRLELKNDTVSRLLCLDLKSLYELAAKSTSEEVQRYVLDLLDSNQDISYEDVRFFKKQLQNPDSQTPLSSVTEQDFNLFTRRLQQFSTWFETQQPVLQIPAQNLEVTHRKELETCFIQLKKAQHMLEDLLAQVNAIPVESVEPETSESET